MIEPGRIFETGRRDLGGLICQIQARLCLDGSIQQRHIWYRTGLGDHDPPWITPWIPSCTRRPDLAFRGMVPAADQRDELAYLIEALRAIEAGHNDPRALAAVALARAGL